MRNVLKLLLIAGALIIVFLPGIQHHWQIARDPYFVPADAVQYIPSFFKYDRFDPVPTTYIKEYYLEAICPPVYKWLTAMGARLGDVRQIQLAKMYAAYFVFIGIMGRLGWVLGGPALSFAVIALTLTGWIFMGLGFMGGAPRMYAYPLVSLIFYALIRERPLLLAGVTLAGAALYPMVGVIAGLCLTAWLLLRAPQSGPARVAEWSWSWRLGVLCGTGLLAAAILTPLLLGSSPYGRRIVAADIEIYPEAGPDGNYRAYDQLPYRLFGQEMLAYYLGPLYAHGDPLFPALNLQQALSPSTSLFALALAGLILLAVILRGFRSILNSECKEGGVRVIAFFAVCGALHVIAWLAAPYLYIPARYFMFSLPFVIPLIFPWSLQAILESRRSLRPSPGRTSAALLAVIALYMMFFGGRGNVAFSDTALRPTDKRLYDAIAALPKESLIAGWPVGQLRKVEYLARRNVFLTGDLHQVLHEKFVQEMRRRMDAVFDAYLSMEPKPVLRLRDEFGVTHLIVDARNFTDGDHAPQYFSPWRSRIQPRLRDIKGREYLLDPSLHEKAAVFQQDGLFLLNLAKMP